MNENAISLGVDILNKFTDIIKTPAKHNTANYVNIFTKVVNYFYSLYIDNLTKMERRESIKILSELEDILKLNIEIIENSKDKEVNKKRISALRSKRNKIMNAYIKILKES
ncbi:BlyB family putative holin accessory protein [Borrelia persica]|uniref:BlyB family putative holin accessory protein n=1 Tax=Borrelia persica TaxID=44448 RepID=UPI000467AAA9|nr:BlyB family putative holin accessory protein [Borrelia persica]